LQKEAKIHAEIYHLKANGKDNWRKMDSVIARVEQARREGIDVTARHVYLHRQRNGPYCFPSTFIAGWRIPTATHCDYRIRKIRAQMKKAMNTNAMDWENSYYGAGGAQGVLLLGFRQDSLRKFIGKATF
jgi:N-acyl-D-amino-acid deacylase